jgi:putative ABC transport system substrate-binding protein
MVLSPESVLARVGRACGVSLAIPIERQLDALANALPGTRRVGILYDPDLNAEFVENATQSGPKLGLRIVPLAVSSRKDIPAVLSSRWKDLDGLWLIPDRTVISESIVRYIIKETLANRVAAIGYNRFFYEAGAALAFVFDYRELGRQTGREALEVLTTGSCQPEPPIFHVWVNGRVADRLGIPIAESYGPPIEVGP